MLNRAGRTGESIERVYKLYRSWGHTPISAYIEARKLKLEPGRMFWFFMLMLDRGLYRGLEDSQC